MSTHWRSPAARLALIGAVSLLCICAAPASQMATAFAGRVLITRHGGHPPNTCRMTGVNVRLAHWILGRHATVSSGATEATSPPNLGTYCSLDSGMSTKGNLVDELFLARAYRSLRQEFTVNTRVTYLHHLGRGAFYAVSSDHSVDDLVFKVGRFTVVISNNLLGGQPPFYYPTRKQYLEFAHAIYHHMR